MPTSFVRYNASPKWHARQIWAPCSQFRVDVLRRATVSGSLASSRGVLPSPFFKVLSAPVKVQASDFSRKVPLSSAVVTDKMKMAGGSFKHLACGSRFLASIRLQCLASRARRRAASMCRRPPHGSPLVVDYGTPKPRGKLRKPA